MTNQAANGSSPRVVPPVASRPLVVDDDGAPNVAFAWVANLTIAALALVALWQIGKRVLG